MSTFTFDEARYVNEHFSSSSIDALYYDRKAQRLGVEFEKSTRVYAYEGVPESVFNLFTEAPSLNGFYRNYIQGRFGESTSYAEVSERETDHSNENAWEMSDEQAQELQTAFKTNEFLRTAPREEILKAAGVASRYSVKWENNESTIGGAPEYDAVDERDALAQFRAAIEAVGFDDYKIVSVTHYLD